MKTEKKTNILFIEDKREDEIAFSSLISEEGLNLAIDTAFTTEEALQKLEFEIFDIIVADYDLLYKQALHFCKEGFTVPIIVMISMDRQRETMDICDFGHCDFFFKDANSHHIKYLPIAIENTLKHNKLEKELIVAKEAANRASRSKTEFLANMTHELRTPLNAILGFSEMMANELAGEVNDTQKAFLHDINESGQLLLSLINDILDLSKIEAGKIELQYSNVHVKDLIERSCLFIRGKASEKKIRIASHIDENAEIIFADEMRIKQVIVNLLSNSVKFTSSDGVITISAEKKDNFVEIAVHDTGMGIKENDFQKLFQPFKQLDTAYDLKRTGSGLGLALCKKIIDLHKGKIRVESQWGKWCRFTITLPCLNQ